MSAQSTDASQKLRRSKITVPELTKLKSKQQPIVMVTAYDFPSALLAEAAGVDCILVGDSLGTTVLGYDNTIPVTLEEILHSVKAVRRGLKNALLIVDLPFGTYQADPADAVRSAVRVMKEGGAEAVKVEGGAHMLETVNRLTRSGIPTMGHLGLTPQSVHVFGGHRAQGKDDTSAAQMIKDAVKLQDAGAFGIVLEAIPAELAIKISASIKIPTIGIGAGIGCDGQVQVWHDLLGLIAGEPYRHVKRYADLANTITNALIEYAADVRNSRFPTKEHSL